MRFSKEKETNSDCEDYANIIDKITKRQKEKKKIKKK